MCVAWPVGSGIDVSSDTGMEAKVEPPMSFEVAVPGRCTIADGATFVNCQTVCKFDAAVKNGAFVVLPGQWGRWLLMASSVRPSRQAPPSEVLTRDSRAEGLHAQRKVNRAATGGRQARAVHDESRRGAGLVAHRWRSG